jgi:hypothetical protein
LFRAAIIEDIYLESGIEREIASINAELGWSP